VFIFFIIIQDICSFIYYYHYYFLLFCHIFFSCFLLVVVRLKTKEEEDTSRSYLYMHIHSTNDYSIMSSDEISATLPIFFVCFFFSSLVFFFRWIKEYIELTGEKKFRR
jgi:hypothetical protein